MRRGLILGTVLTLSLAPVPGRADVTVAPPFEDAYSDHHCDGSPISACTSDASADVSGAFSFEASLVSPGAGSLPGPGSAGATAQWGQTGTIPKPIPGIELTIDIHIDEASVVRLGGLSDLGYGRIDAYAEATVSACFCYGYADALIADESMEAIQDHEVRLTLTLRNQDGGPLYSGRVSMFVQLWASGSLGGNLFVSLPNTGTLDLSASGSITSVTARVLSE